MQDENIVGGNAALAAYGTAGGGRGASGGGGGGVMMATTLTPSVVSVSPVSVNEDFSSGPLQTPIFGGMIGAGIVFGEVKVEAVKFEEQSGVKNESPTFDAHSL